MVVRFAPGTATLCRANAFDGVKVFSSTKLRDREQLGEAVTAWLGGHRHLEVVDIAVRQSSDECFHCVSILLFFRNS